MKKIHLAFVFLIIWGSCQKDNNDNKNDNTVSDIDGNIYHTVKIGTQIWMVENLKTTKYRNGDLIGTTSPVSLDIYDEFQPKYQWAYIGDESNAAVYGRLYTWYAITDSRGLCPSGWHVPSEAEWMELETFIGGWYQNAVKLKETGAAHWVYQNEGSTNTTGFTALPGGERDFSNDFTWIQYYGFWWTTTESTTDGNAIGRIISGTDLLTTDVRKSSAFSVRCVKD
jgi:uncharacterized protein (TIGR02145 family)